MRDFLFESENLIRLAIYFEGRTAQPASEYDKRPLNLLYSAANLVHAKRNNEMNLVSSPTDASELLNKAIEIVSESNCYCDDDTKNNEIAYEQISELRLEAQKLAYGDEKKSNIDNYGYDLVFASTLGAVNATMKEYIDKTREFFPEHTVYYVEKFEQGKVIYEEAPSDLVKEFDSMDLFSIPDNISDRSDIQKANLDKAYNEMMLAFAFRAAIGFPEGADIDNIIEFNEGELGSNTKVLYNLYFKKISIIQFSVLRGGEYIFNNIQQSGQPWVFKFTVDLGLVGKDLDDLSDSVKKMINNIEPGQMFSISQLFLDLNTTKLMSSPSISGASPQANYQLNAFFLPYTFQKIRDTSGDVIFGYTIIPKSIPGEKSYLITPKDFRFCISPYWKDGKKNPGKQKLYTLNYLVVCEEKPFPEVKQFDWNWVEENEYSKKNGILCISNKQILKFAEKEYANFIKNLLCKVDVSMTIKDPIKIHWSVSICQDRDTIPEFKKHVYKYSSSKKDSDTFIPLWGNICLRYDLTANLRTYQTEDGKALIECRVDIVAFAHVNIEGGVSEGNIFNKTTWYTLEVNIDEYGALTLKPGYKETDNGKTFDISKWSSAIALGDLDAKLNDSVEFIKKRISEQKKMWDKNFMEHYNKNALWYIPGNESLILKDPTFSNNKDLNFDANYASPNAQ